MQLFFVQNVFPNVPSLPILEHHFYQGNWSHLVDWEYNLQYYLLTPVLFLIIVSFAIFLTTVSILLVNSSPAFYSRDTSYDMVISDTEVTIKKGWMIYFVCWSSIFLGVDFAIYSVDYIYRCVWCWHNIYFNILFKLLFIMHLSSDFVILSILWKYLILNLHNFGVDSPTIMKCSYKLPCFAIDFKMLHLYSDLCGSKIEVTFVEKKLWSTLVEFFFLDLLDISPDICTDTLIYTPPMSTWSKKFDNSLDIWGLFSGWKLDVKKM